MKIKRGILTCLIIVPLCLSAQVTGIRGRVLDSAGQRVISQAVVMALSDDSALTRFTRTGESGRFFLDNLYPGRYRLLITHPNLSDYWRYVSVTGDRVEDMGDITPPPKADSLSTVVVTPGPPKMRLRGDTVEYSTSGIALKAHATVEELLQRLPGIQVNPDGSIIVNGQKIEKLLVDGEDIFGADPKNISRNFNADLFSKVQVLDKKSSRALITGIEDGKQSKTLNLVTKAGRQKGTFGKAEAGIGTGSYYNGNGLVGVFEGKRQFAALGLVSNTGTTGFAGSGGEGNDAVGMSVNGGTDDGLSTSAGKSIPNAAGGGVHYSNWWPGAEHASGNYAYGHTVTYPITSNETKQVLPDTVYFQSQQNRSVNTVSEQSFSGIYDVNPDTVSTFHFALNVYGASSRNRFSGITSTYLNDTAVNRENRTVTSEVRNQVVAGSAYWSRKLRKKGRVLSVTADAASLQSKSDGYIYSVNAYLAAADTTDQKKTVLSENYTMEGSLNFREPLSNAAVLALSYDVSYNHGKSLLDTYGRGDGKYTVSLDSLSSHFAPELFRESGRINLQWKTRRLALAAGADASHISLREEDITRKTRGAYRYTFIGPHVFGHYTFNETYIFYFSYNAGQRVPSFTQLQPLQNNTDPLHISVGNPGLQPVTSHSFGIRFFRVRPFPINIGVQGSFEANEITSRSRTDSLGKQVIQAVNINGNKTIGSYLSLSRKILPAGLDFGINAGLSYTRLNGYVNEALSRNDAYNSYSRVTLGKLKGKYQIQASSEISYTYSKSSVNTGAVTRFWTQTYTLLADLPLLWDIEWNTNFSITILQEAAGFSGSNELLIWDSYLNKDLPGGWSVRLKGVNLLGQRAGTGRSIAGNQVSETSSNNLTGRYLLLSVIFHFSHERS